MEYDIPYPIYILYIGRYNVPLGVIYQGRVVTCFTLPLRTTATGRKYMPKGNVAVTNSSKWQVSRIPSHRELTYAGNLGAGRTAAEVAPISGNPTTAGIQKFTNGIPQVPQQVVGEIWLTSGDQPRHHARPRDTAPQRATVQRATAQRDATQHRAAQHDTTDPNLRD